MLYQIVAKENVVQPASQVPVVLQVAARVFKVMWSKLEWKERPLLRCREMGRRLKHWARCKSSWYTAVRGKQRHQPSSVLDEEIDVEGHQEAECDDKHLTIGWTITFSDRKQFFLWIQLTGGSGPGVFLPLIELAQPSSIADAHCSLIVQVNVKRSEFQPETTQTRRGGAGDAETETKKERTDEQREMGEGGGVRGKGGGLGSA